MKHRILIRIISAVALCLTGCASTQLTAAAEQLLVSGAMGQLYTLENSAAAFSAQAVSSAIGRVITDPTLKATVTLDAVNAINAELANGSPLNIAINDAVTAVLNKFQGAS